jgi:hypothetical protein
MKNPAYLMLALKALLPLFSDLTIILKTPIFSREFGKSPDGGIGIGGENKGVCKENIFIRPPAFEKSNYLSVARYQHQIQIGEKMAWNIRGE